MLYKPPKRKFPKGHFKGQKRPHFHFSTLSLSLWSIFRASRVSSNDIKSIPEFRCGSLLYPPFKKIACYYWLMVIILAFLPKIWLSNWPWFLKVGQEGSNKKNKVTFITDPQNFFIIKVALFFRFDLKSDF